MTAKYVCSNNPSHVYAHMTDDNFCEKCGIEGILLPIEDAKVIDIEDESKELTRKEEGDCGLGILLMDFSSSMYAEAFPEMDEFRVTKIELVGNALASAISQLSAIGQKEKAYVAFVGFTKEAKLVKLIKASEIEDDAEYWRTWLFEQQNKILNDVGDGTNITGALKLAKEIYDHAIYENMDNYEIEGLKEFAPLYHRIVIGNETVPSRVANVRVFLYSDGVHNTGDFINPFEDASLIPGKSNVSGLITAYFGGSKDNGYRNLEEIAGVCPIHNTKGIFHINSPRSYDFLRRLFHMASAASGFCLQCAKKPKI